MHFDALIAAGMWCSLVNIRGLGLRDPSSNLGIPISHMAPTRKVSTIIFYDDKKILIQDRRKISKCGEEYGFFGGKIEEGETPEEALKREMKEELNLNIENYALFKHQKRLIPEINMEVDIHLFIAPMPNFNKISVHEGGLALMSFEDSFKLKMLSGDVELIEELQTFLMERQNNLKTSLNKQK